VCQSPSESGRPPVLVRCLTWSLEVRQRRTRRDTTHRISSQVDVDIDESLEELQSKVILLETPSLLPDPSNTTSNLQFHPHQTEISRAQIPDLSCSLFLSKEIIQSNPAQIHKYTNTQIQIHKYKNTKIQKYKYTHVPLSSLRNYTVKSCSLFSNPGLGAKWASCIPGSSRSV
jgi:hypothetical protein